VIRPFLPFIDTGFVSVRSPQHPTSALAGTFMREFRRYVDEWSLTLPGTAPHQDARSAPDP